jgi:hypothetical protein
MKWVTCLSVTEAIAPWILPSSAGGASTRITPSPVTTNAACVNPEMTTYPRSPARCSR